MKKLIIFLTTIVVIVCAHFCFAQSDMRFTDDRWTLLGTRLVDYLIDHDIIPIADNKDGFIAIKFVIKNGPLNMFKCKIHFKDGESKDVAFAEDIQANDVRIVDLKGSYRPIEKISFWYETKTSSDNKSVVEVWGNVK